MSYTVFVQPGDTLERIAVRELGDALRWPEIAGLNRLVAPYLVIDAAPYRAVGVNVLEPGDVLRIPAAGSSARTALDAEVEAYGVDLAWSETTFLLQREGTQIGLDRGVENLRKKVYRAIITKPGELIRHPELGNPAWQHLGSSADPYVVMLATLDTKTAILVIDDILSVQCTAEFTADGALDIRAACEPKPPAERFTVRARLS